MILSRPLKNKTNKQIKTNKKKPPGLWGTWVAQSVKQPTVESGSDHDLTVHGIKPRVRLCTDSMEPAWDSLPVSLCPSPTRAHIRTLSHSQNK